MSRPFADRAEAGQILAEKLAAYRDRDDVIVLGLPRGGVPVAYEVAEALGAPLDVFLVRKLGAPGQEELAMGAIASGDVVVINDEVVEALEGVLTDLADRLGAVGLACGVAEVDHCLVGQLVHDGTGDGQSAEARVEDPDRRIIHNPTG